VKNFTSKIIFKIR